MGYLSIKGFRSENWHDNRNGTSQFWPSERYSMRDRPKGPELPSDHDRWDLRDGVKGTLRSGSVSSKTRRWQNWSEYFFLQHLDTVFKVSRSRLVFSLVFVCSRAFADRSFTSYRWELVMQWQYATQLAWFPFCLDYQQNDNATENFGQISTNPW